MKIQTVTLKDVGVQQVEGTYQKVYTNIKTYPAFLTNYAMKKGKELGILESSLFRDVLQFQALGGLETSEEINPEVLEQVDETNMHKVIYIAFTGANPDKKMSFDDFLRRYHEPLQTTMELYMNLVVDLIDQNPNRFAQALQKSTSNKRGKQEKKLNRRKSR
ncbi:hypothetical protein [Bacillus albus]|uniref:hypothetical protein n=1 Tax=Bacillus albus TaxID=2026189 RepID=UPI0010202ADE|nr:hypothetical protein [Bacillus albus]